MKIEKDQNAETKRKIEPNKKTEKNLRLQEIKGLFKVALVSLVFSFFGAWLFFKLEMSPLAKASASYPILQASRIDLLDANGKVRAQIGFSGEKSPALWFFDTNGKARMNLGVYGDGSAFLSLQDKSELSIQLLRSFGSPEMPLHIYKSSGSDQMIQGLNPGAGNEPFLMFYDKNRKRQLSFGKYDGP